MLAGQPNTDEPMQIVQGLKQNRTTEEKLKVADKLQLAQRLQAAPKLQVIAQLDWLWRGMWIVFQHGVRNVMLHFEK